MNTPTANRETRHFAERAALRGLRPETLRFILLFGREVCAADAVHLTVLERDLPPDLRDHPEARRARDWIVICGHDGALLTCYRRAAAFHFLRVKPKRSTLPRAA